MTQLILNISDPSVLPTLKRVVKAFKGVTIKSDTVPEHTELAMSYAEAKAGQTTTWDSVDALIAHANDIANGL